MNLHDPGTWIPFALMTGQAQPRWNLQRLLEALIIASATGGVVMYATQQVLGAEIAHLKAVVVELRQEVHQIRSDFYIPRINQRTQP